MKLTSTERAARMCWLTVFVCHGCVEEVAGTGVGDALRNSFGMQESLPLTLPLDEGDGCMCRPGALPSACPSTQKCTADDERATHTHAHTQSLTCLQQVRLRTDG